MNEQKKLRSHHLCTPPSPFSRNPPVGYAIHLSYTRMIVHMWTCLTNLLCLWDDYVVLPLGYTMYM